MNIINDEWECLREVLLTSTASSWSLKELLYLEKAFFDIEHKWHQALDEIKEPRFIILGEAPLYGNKGSYIYSTKSPATTFLRPSDFPNLHGQREKNNKCHMLDTMRTQGIIVVDLFPYALNENDTPTMDYRKIQDKPEYPRLLKNSFEAFTKKKILNVVSKNSSVSFLIRYKRIMRHAEPLIESLGIKKRDKIGFSNTI